MVWLNVALGCECKIRDLHCYVFYFELSFECLYKRRWSVLESHHWVSDWVVPVAAGSGGLLVLSLLVTGCYFLCRSCRSSGHKVLSFMFVFMILFVDTLILPLLEIDVIIIPDNCQITPRLILSALIYNMFSVNN